MRTVKESQSRWTGILYFKIMRKVLLFYIKKFFVLSLLKPAERDAFLTMQHTKFDVRLNALPVQ